MSSKVRVLTNEHCWVEAIGCALLLCPLDSIRTWEHRPMSVWCCPLFCFSFWVVPMCLWVLTKQQLKCLQINVFFFFNFYGWLGRTKVIWTTQVVEGCPGRPGQVGVVRRIFFGQKSSVSRFFWPKKLTDIQNRLIFWPKKLADSRNRPIFWPKKADKIGRKQPFFMHVFWTTWLSKSRPGWLGLSMFFQEATR